MISIFSIGYMNSTVILLFVCGMIGLTLDQRVYKKNNMKKELAVARALGWFNVSVGAVLFVGNWLYQHFIW